MGETMRNLMRLPLWASIPGIVAISLAVWINPSYKTFSDPLDIPIIPDSGVEFGQAKHNSVHINPNACKDWPDACEWVKWHERGHIILGHTRHQESRGNEDAADRYANEHASSRALRAASEYYRSLHQNGQREIGPHASFLERSKLLYAASLKAPGTDPAQRSPLKALVENVAPEPMKDARKRLLATKPGSPEEKHILDQYSSQGHTYGTKDWHLPKESTESPASDVAANQPYNNGQPEDRWYSPDPHWKVERELWDQRGRPFERPTAPAERVKVPCWEYGDECGVPGGACGKIRNLSPGRDLYKEECDALRPRRSKQRPVYAEPRQRDCPRGGSQAEGQEE
jgi:hypothetical protein